MYRLAKRFSFCAAHRLLDLPDGHKCSRLHGHNYEVEIVAQTPLLDQRGFAELGYAEFSPFKSWLDGEIDHRTILTASDPLCDALSADNIVVVAFNTTAENLAKWFLDVARAKVSPFVSSVWIAETPSTWVEYKAPN